MAYDNPLWSAISWAKMNVSLPCSALVCFYTMAVTESLLTVCSLQSTSVFEVSDSPGLTLLLAGGVIERAVLWSHYTSPVFFSWLFEFALSFLFFSKLKSKEQTNFLWIIVWIKAPPPSFKHRPTAHGELALSFFFRKVIWGGAMIIWTQLLCKATPVSPCMFTNQWRKDILDMGDLISVCVHV